MSGMIRLFGGKILVSVFALAVFILLGFSYDAPFLYIALASAILHELSHIAAFHIFGAKIYSVSIYPFGADMKADTSNLSYGREAIVALCGPFASLLLFVSFAVLFVFCRNIYVLSAAISNFLFFAVNIFPVRSLDGGVALFCVLLSKYDFAKGYTIYSYVSGAAFALLCAFALFLLYVTGYNLTLVFICTYLFISQYTRQKVCE